MENKSNLTNFTKVYQAAIFRIDNVLILVLGILFCIFLGKFFVLGILFLTFGIITKAFILAAKPEFIRQILNPPKSFEIKNLIQILTKELNKSYLEQVKINFQNARQELIKINKNFELINKNKNFSKNNLQSNSTSNSISNSFLQPISFENTGFDDLDFLVTTLPELIDKVLILSSEEQKIRKFLQTENKEQIQIELDSFYNSRQNLENYGQDFILNSDLTKQNRQLEQIENKKSQLETILNFEKELDQIESYLNQIQTELSAISLFTAKLSLPTKKMTTDNYLLTNLNKLNLEIDTFTDQINKIE